MNPPPAPQPGDAVLSAPVRAGLQLAAVAVAICLAAWLGIELTRGTGRIATIWVANALVLVAILRLERKLWLGLLGAGFVGFVLANLLSGDDGLTAAGLAAVNAVEIVICAAPFLAGRIEADFTRPRTLLLFSLIAAGPAVILSSLLAAGFLATVADADFAVVLLRWYPADALGLITITPVLMVLKPADVAALFRRPMVGRTALSIGGLAIVLAIVFNGAGPLLFMVLPALLFVVFQLGMTGAAISVVGVGIVAFVMTLNGLGPLAFAEGSPQLQVALLQVFIAVTAMQNLVVAAALAERSRLEQDLRAAKAAAETSEADRDATASMLATTLDSMDQGLIMIQADGTIPVVNRRAAEMLGLPPELLAREPLSNDELVRFQAARGDFDRMPGEIRHQIEYPLAHTSPLSFEGEQRDGTIIETRSTPIGSGGLVRTFTDVTARRAAEEEVRSREALYRLLAENSSDMISRLELNGVRAYVSPASETLFGVPPSSLVGHTPFERVHPDDLATTREAFLGIAQGEHDTDTVVYRARHADGHYVWIEANLKLVRDAQTRAPLEMVAAVRDVSAREEKTVQLTEARRRAEEALAEARDAYQAAEAALKRAEEAGRAKDEFLAAMSHEMRTPLNSITGFAEIVLGRKDLAPEAERQIRLIENAARALLTVVNDVLDFSEIEAGRVVLHSEPFMARKLAEDVVAIVKSAADAKSIALEMQLDPEIPDWLLGDGNRIAQVVLNLLNNAVKFTPRGRITLTLACDGRREGGGWLRCSVADTGIGIPADKQGLLFQRFSQIDSSIRRRFGGSGLGLAICKRLVEMMGGEIGVDSTEGQGSVFWFRVPMKPSEAPRDLDAGSSRTDLPARVLVVDDTPMNLEIAATILRDAGHTVDVVDNGEDAVAKAAAGGYDVVLMDIQMPGMDGVTAARLIRDLPPPACDVVILAMTASVLPTQVETFLSAGMNDALGKPFTRKQLTDTIARWSHHAEREPLLADEQPAFEKRVFEELREMLGNDKMQGHLGSLIALMDELPGQAAPSDLRGIEQKAHKLVSISGMMGFRQLSEAAARLEAACRDGRDVSAALTRLGAARDEARRIAGEPEIAGH